MVLSSVVDWLGNWLISEFKAICSLKKQFLEESNHVIRSHPHSSSKASHRPFFWVWPVSFRDKGGGSETPLLTD